MVGTVSALAGRVGALSKNFSGMVGASNVVAVMVSALAVRVSALAGRVSALVVRVSALAGRVGVQEGAISAVTVLA